MRFSQATVHIISRPGGLCGWVGRVLRRGDCSVSVSGSGRAGGGVGGGVSCCGNEGLDYDAGRTD